MAENGEAFQIRPKCTEHRALGGDKLVTLLHREGYGPAILELPKSPAATHDHWTTKRDKELMNVSLDPRAQP
jgi:hypothetical protein